MRVPMLRLTKRAIEALPHPASGQVLYYDDQLRGFGLRAGLKSKVFFAERQIKRRTVRVTIGKFELTSPEKARRIALGLLAQMADGQNPNAKGEESSVANVTLGDAFDRFFADKPHLSATTIPNYQRTINTYLADWAKRPIADVSRQMVLDRHRRIAEQHGAVTANNAMRHLRSVYNYTSATVGELPANPVTILGQARAWAPERRRRTIIPLHALPRWYRAVLQQDEQARDFLLLALFTGMRRSELATLRWEHIDLEGRTLRVPRTKNGDPLELPLSSFIRTLLKDRRDTATASEWVFPGRGRTGHLTEMKSFVARVATNSGVAFTLHDLRRTFVTVAESLDIPAYALKRLLNHRGGDVTAGYIVISTERLRAPVERISSYLEEKLNNAPCALQSA